jgi:hypothetical protein
VTAAGVILIAMGAVQLVAGLVLLVLSPEDLARIGPVGNVDFQRIARGIGVFTLVIGVVGVLAGILVVRLVEGGRILGLVLSFLLLLGGVGSLAKGSGIAVVTLGLYGFVVYALFANGTAFRRSAQG